MSGASTRQLVRESLERQRRERNPQAPASDLTKREHIAAIAMQGILATGYEVGVADGDYENAAYHAVRMADALLNDLEDR